MNTLPSLHLWDQVRPLIKRAEKALRGLQKEETAHVKAGDRLQEKRSRAQRILRAAEAAWLLTDPVITEFPTAFGEEKIKCAHVLMVHTHDFIDGEKGARSKARAEAAVWHAGEGNIPHSALVIFPQGYQKKNPTVSAGRSESLGKNVANYYAVCRSTYLGHKYEDFASNILCMPLGWGTLDDVLNAYKMVKDRGYHYARFYMVSDRTHLKRIKLVWDKTHPEGWLVEYLPTAQPALSLFDRLVRERVARIVYRWRLFRMKRMPFQAP
jgi:hypothetical protein